MSNVRMPVLVEMAGLLAMPPQVSQSIGQEPAVSQNECADQLASPPIGWSVVWLPSAGETLSWYTPLLLLIRGGIGERWREYLTRVVGRP